MRDLVDTFYPDHLPFYPRLPSQSESLIFVRQEQYNICVYSSIHILYLSIILENTIDITSNCSCQLHI